MKNHKKTQKQLNKSTLVLAIASILNSGALYAQESSESDLAIERIEVTAQKRVQSIQEVPIALSAFNGDELTEAGIVTVQNIQNISPSLSISSSTSESRNSTIRIRGVGTTGNNTGLESSVGVFVDGVYLSRTGIAMNDLLDIERIEVLRGPQGTLFGKNTTSGALSITTSLPEFDYSAFVGLTYGSDNLKKIKGSVTGSLVDDQLAGRFAFTRNTSDGYIDDINTGIDYNNKNRYTMRGQLLFTPQDDISLRIIADYGKKDEDCCASPYLQYGPTKPLIPALGGTIASENPFDRKVAVNDFYHNDTENYGISGELKWDFEDTYLTLISSYRNDSYLTLADGDRSDMDLINSTTASEVEAVTTELRIQGTSGFWNWMTGIYLFSEDISEQSDLLYGTQMGDYFSAFVPTPGLKALVSSSYVEGGGAVLNDYSQDTKGWSIFTHNDFELSDDLTVTAGIRYNSETKKGGGEFISDSTVLCHYPAPLSALGFLCPVPDYTSDKTYDEVTGTLKMSYKLDKNLMFYGGYSRGFKAGGINLDRDAGLSNFEFLPETVDSFELGFKSEFLDNRVRFNAAMYYSEFNDFQISTFDGISYVVSNAAGATSKGAELDVTALLTEELMVEISYAYNDAQYTDDTIDPKLAGQQLSNAPESIATIVFSYDKELTNDLNGFANLNARYQSGTNTGANLDPDKYQSAYTVTNARLGIRSMDDSWEVALWANNLLDEDYSVLVIDAPGQKGSLTTFLGQSATYGIDVMFRFE